MHRPAGLVAGVGRMTRLLALLPPWVPLAAAGVLLLALGGAVWGWLDAREDLGAMRVSAAVNAASVKALSDQQALNLGIANRLEQLAVQRAAPIKETVREIYLKPASDACRNSPAMRALDGRLRYGGDGQGGGSAAAGQPAPAVPATR
jgi:hypothetical protein